MVTFYRVNALSWILGRWMVKAPFLSMVNLVAGRQVAAELIQDEMTGERIAAEALRLLNDDGARRKMKADLEEVKQKTFERTRSDGSGGGVRCRQVFSGKWIAIGIAQ